ncbi:hypothetical protein [Pedobacter gandavensis]|uniref:hypothetical protein n=1 Tax=Pedobacter gandavensis TaxID=2679963 RepID=UPI00292CE29C|nr:hypothetical protein [Pedobacter gandavensis]
MKAKAGQDIDPKESLHTGLFDFNSCSELAGSRNIFARWLLRRDTCREVLIKIGVKFYVKQVEGTFWIPSLFYLRKQQNNADFIQAIYFLSSFFIFVAIANYI